MDSIRVLEPGDEALVEAFCARHPDTTLFFLNNMQAAGLADRGERYQGTWAASFIDGEIRALAGHFWNGNVILEAPEHLPEVVSAAVRWSGRPVHGMIGRSAQAHAARAVLGLVDAPATMESEEILFRLPLERLRVPAMLAQGDVVCRQPRPDDLPLLVDWRHAYLIEALNEEDTPELREQVRLSMAEGEADARIWVLEHRGALVSMTAFNAAVPQAVQVGGVYTPPELRSKGYAAAAVAGSLCDARERGVPRAILFTAHDNHPAQACYRGLGFEEIGTYGLILLEQDSSAGR